MKGIKRFMSLKAISALRSTAKPLEPLRIQLTDVEDKLCTLLNECTLHIVGQEHIETSCRYAGGWVRDKLLGLHSNDIDVAVSNMTGLTFARHLASFVRSNKDIDMKDPVKVEANPDQSKHLETAKTGLWGLELDLVNLRCEEYTENSRIPNQITFGTPLVDALRRDITINALFYNVHSRSIEDHTGKGLDDLKHGVIRTPLPPRETFLDDPLRVIRTVRFASRFGFQMVQELKDAARDPVIQSALVQKISRDRVGEELDKMMKGCDPLHSIQLINELSLYNVIFYASPATSNSFSSAPADTNQSLIAATILQTLTEPTTICSLPELHPTLLTAFSSHPSTKPRLYLASALTPYASTTYEDHKGKTHPGSEIILREGVKLGSQNHYLDGIPDLFAAANLLCHPLLNDERFKKPSERVAIGLLLRDRAVHNPNVGSTWQISLLFSLVQELVPFWSSEDSYNSGSVAKCITTYNHFVSRVEELGLSDVGDTKPILNGNEVVKILSAKPGPWTGHVLSKVMEWQLDHPQGTVGECSEWLVSESAQGRVSVTSEHSSQKRIKKGGESVSKKAKR